MFKKLLILTLLMLGLQMAQAQIVTECPQNIGFESGTFANWDSLLGRSRVLENAFQMLSDLQECHLILQVLYRVIIP